MKPTARRGRGVVLSGVCLFVLSLGFTAPSPAASPDPLWEKAAALADRMEREKAAFDRMEMHSQVRKKDGSIEEDMHLVFRIVEAGEDYEAELVSAVRNGEDVTEKLREEERKAEEKQAGEAGKQEEDGTTLEAEPTYHPFAAEIRSEVTYKRMSEVPFEGGRAVTYRFEHRPGKGEGCLKGRVWLDPDSGSPLQVEVSPDPLPKHVDEIVTRIRFETTPEGDWRPVSCSMDGSGGMLWIKRSFTSTFTFSEFRKGGADGAGGPPREAPSS